MSTVEIVWSLVIIIAVVACAIRGCCYLRAKDRQRQEEQQIAAVYTVSRRIQITQTHVHPTQEDNMAFQLEDLPPSYEDAIKILPPPPVYNSTVTTISDTVR